MIEEKEKNTKNYRPNVAAIVLSSKYPLTCDVFIASRIDVDTNAWQFPQGGIDEGEDVEAALFRELKEEIGTDDVSIVAKYPKWVSYDFPQSVAKKMAPYDGQKQQYFLVKLNSGAKINIDTEIPEFDDYKFVPSKNIFDHVTYFKRTVYKEVLQYFKKEGYL
ncbi:MAG: RNA pyrophosphohydrolase [Campylobacteraceae bacterium]|jgi:putative (di)nucleoside polyphosphate hydrolase|nr:RNA pyrophosphohydrolase [Campylobacteraceae bacterium]MBT3882977.1 RNA pyrophosphohydrolase [Campylobacteraceae bacterium]MBT4030527.1 RNA pyrophosphohydrolase [Campylobacteraceae bacterium]MBT4179538.1 RNA pyrophosphohydrolase [Campylobacteraceae bacterium]MBT4572229.1 RNA pyrophosphohydrolase [Campylobacteraceae bacterium]